jgi:hypothetical protein
MTSRPTPPPATYRVHVRRLINEAARAPSWRAAAPLLDQAANLARAAAAQEEELDPDRKEAT